jgi:hypothetical protein
MRSFVPALLTLPALGCVYVDTRPARIERVEVLDPHGVSVPEAWSVSWSVKRTCPLGLLCWFPFGNLSLWPDLRSVSEVRLQRLTPRDNLRTRSAEYRSYVQWGLLILPPGTYCESWSRSYVFAAGCPWGFDGEHWTSPDGRVLARARPKPAEGRVSDQADHVRAAGLAPLLEDVDVPREDLRDFARMLLRNLELLEVKETGPPDVMPKLRGLAR